MSRAASVPYVVKADGSVEAFSEAKLLESLRRSGAPASVAERVAERVSATLAPGTETKRIYRRAFQMLRRETKPVAARYGLRRALFEFGPTGHPFEDFVSALFEREGWTVSARQEISGKCVTHEVDVYAVKNGEHLAAELKYHNDPGYRTDVKVALYVKARFDDIWQCEPSMRARCPVTKGMLITNTKFTSHAIEYATCAGIELVGWSYPHRGNLYDRIVRTGVMPVTVLSSLTRAEKNLLIGARIVTCGALRERRAELRGIVGSAERIGAILAESDAVCAPYGHVV